MSNLDAFIEESNRIEGIRRKPLDYEVEAHKTLLTFPILTVSTLIHFVHVVAHAPLRRDPGNRTRLRIGADRTQKPNDYAARGMVLGASHCADVVHVIPLLSMGSEKRTARSGTA